MPSEQNRRRCFLPHGGRSPSASRVHENVRETSIGYEYALKVEPKSRLTRPISTRPLAIQKDGTWYCYGWDLTKNICEIYSTTGYIRTVYTYTPYGEVTASGNVTQSPRGLGGGLDKPKGFAPQGRGRNGVRPSQPIQWSSEYADTELGLIYYNYRYYNPTDGRWCRRDIELKAVNAHLYSYVSNTPIITHDILGNFAATATAVTTGLVITTPALIGALAAVFIVGAIIYVATRKCPACPPPTQQPGSRLDCVPPSRSHYPCKGNHLHSWVFVMHQNPITCGCFEKKEETITCL